MEDEKVEVSKEVAKPKEEKKSRYEQIEVVTETGIAVKDNSTEKILNNTELLVEILNKLDNVEKAISS